MKREEWLYNAARMRLAQQLHDVDALNAKVNTLLVVSAALALLFAGFTVNSWPYIGGAGLVGVIPAFIVLLAAYRVHDWHNAPPINWLRWHEKHDTSLEEIACEALENIESCYDDNHLLIQAKSKRINDSSCLLLLGIIAALVTTFIRFSISLS